MTSGEPSAPPSPPSAPHDLEKRSTHIADNTAVDEPQHDEIDIEHAYVDDDPREWSRRKKVCYTSSADESLNNTVFPGMGSHPSLRSVCRRRLLRQHL